MDVIDLNSNSQLFVILSLWYYLQRDNSSESQTIPWTFLSPWTPHEDSWLEKVANSAICLSLTSLKHSIYKCCSLKQHMWSSGQSQKSVRFNINLCANFPRVVMFYFRMMMMMMMMILIILHVRLKKDSFNHYSFLKTLIDQSVSQIVQPTWCFQSKCWRDKQNPFSTYYLYGFVLWWKWIYCVHTGGCSVAFCSFYFFSQYYMPELTTEPVM